MLIRDAKISDSSAISTMLTELGYADTDLFIEKKIAQQLAHNDAKIFVATDKNNILGFISLHFIPQLALEGDFCRISYFCVSQASRSKGVGAELEKHTLQLAKKRNCNRIEVHCHSRRKGAHEFYKKQGYNESPKYLIKMIEL
ncbi:GNAT family N-acetyltransferase [Aliikangiella coralliicola]|uniref:GNAT family N-acetyltransferase n=1 Tax=Aliikangiella coralliicola TaxID=2592383 RepID=A0A545UJE1_9GAMM|nr:GNAT family N-acetyltransferase [Aliikangiella coralliicola]TQV89579.1 GNAT family N-acetyltransferase [Aliikangiella coralliicola]